MKAWYFCGDDRKLRYGDGRAIVDGETLTVEGELVLCKWGLHASRRLIDALAYAPGAVLCRVEMGETIVEGEDKVVAASRKVLWSIPSDKVLPVLAEFARWCAAAAAEYAAGAAEYAAEYAAGAAKYAAGAAGAAKYAAEYAAEAAEYAYAKSAATAAEYAEYAATARAKQEAWLLNKLTELGYAVD